MARRANYGFEKRQKEMKRQEKKDEKEERKRARKEEVGEMGETVAQGDGDPGSDSAGEGG